MVIIFAFDLGNIVMILLVVIYLDYFAGIDEVQGGDCVLLVGNIYL